MESFASQIKRLRKERGVPLRIVAAFLGIDQAILSKIENGKRIATRENIVRLARYFHLSVKDLTVSWLSDKLLDEIDNEDLALAAFKVAEEKIAYRKIPHLSKEKIIEIIREFLKKDGRVSKAWIFGSFARGDYNYKSDIDIMVRYSDKASGNLSDYADIKFFLENLIHKEIDLVEEGYIKSFAIENVERDILLIYG
jgi:predicted nucleotidyltransferase